MADRIDIGRLVSLHLGRHRMGAEEGRADRHAPFAAQSPRRAQLAAFCLELESIAGFDLDGRGTLGNQRVETRLGAGHEIVLARQACRLHGRGDAATAQGNFRVACPGEPQLELLGAVAAIDEVRMAIDQARGDPATLAVDRFPGIEAGRSVPGRTCIDDFPGIGCDQAVFDEAEPGKGWRERRKTAAVPDPINCHDGSCNIERLACGEGDEARIESRERSPFDMGGGLSRRSGSA